MQDGGSVVADDVSIAQLPMLSHHDLLTLRLSQTPRGP